MDRYSLVGCNECSALWVVDGRPETTRCPRCRKRHQFKKLKKFVTSDDEDHVREVRTSILANRQGQGDAYAELDSFTELEARADERVVSDEEYLEGSGLDVDEVTAAGDRASTGQGGRASRRETVEAALGELDRPTEADVVAYVEDRGVDGEYARTLLERLRRHGEVTERDGVYRLL